MDRPLVIAVAKGALWSEGQGMLAKLGYEFDVDFSKSRKLFAWDTKKRLKVLMVRSWDVPTYVEQGAADVGIVGKDVLLEQSPFVVELLDLGFGGCSLVLAGPKEMTPDQLGHNISVGTKYWNSTERYFLSRGLKINPIKLYGAIELAPLTGLADYICDLTATGTTLRENHLHVIDTLFTSTARLIANRASMSTQYSAITALRDGLQDQL